MLERKDIGVYSAAPDDELIVCRCEEITKGEIRRAIHDGFFTLAEIRRFLRAGMGLCQGQTCGRLVKTLIARELGVSPAAVEPATARAPLRPVEMRVLADNQEKTND
jgi:NAD(P)H-nitrite reductase large subunit